LFRRDNPKTVSRILIISIKTYFYSVWKEGLLSGAENYIKQTLHLEKFAKYLKSSHNLIKKILHDDSICYSENWNLTLS
jgi:hypothetical protein